MMLVLTALPLGAPTAMAQTAMTQTPARNANIWDGKKHEPDPATVQQNEHSAGIALPPAQQKVQTDQVEQQADKLIAKSHADDAAAQQSH